MQTGICHIVGAGEFTPRGLCVQPGDLLIAADGGYAYLSQMGLFAHLLVGDFDSLGHVPAGVETIRHPVEKDDTDMGLAIREGMARGYKKFRLYGGSGGRIDHFLANLQLLAAASSQGAQAVLVCPDYDVHAVTDGALAFPPAEKGTLFSVFCHGDAAEGVSLSGLQYSLNEACLSAFHPLGVSNAYTGQAVEVRVRRGTLIVLDYAV